MKTYLLITFFFMVCLFRIDGQLIFMEDFENYNQGSISAQNGLWSDLSGATTDVTYNGGSYLACSATDVNQAYLSFVSNDFIAVNRSMTTTGTQILIEVKILAIDGFFIKFSGNDNDFFIYSNNSYNNIEAYLQFSMNFFYNQMQVFQDGQLLGVFDIPDFITNLESVMLANEAGDFRLGCISLWDTTDNDADGYLATDDCNDNNPDINPGAPEIPYDGLDNDCNPVTVDDDIDQDGFLVANDCNDNDASVNPNQIEVTYNGKDDDCNTVTLDDDLDSDGYFLILDCNDTNANINPGETEIPYNGIDEDCNLNSKDDDLDGDGYVLANDCNDNNPDVNPDAEEIPYDGVDNDCNPNSKDDDLDGDGYVKIDDCNDEDSNINPGEDEIPYNGIDEDCSSDTRDDDLDVDGFVIDNDCDDENPDINPAAEEIPGNMVDDNCDGEIDEVTSTSSINQEKLPKVFPNPSNDFIQIEGAFEIEEIILMDCLGRKLGNFKNNIINLEFQPLGIYILKILCNDKQVFNIQIQKI